MPLAVRYFDDPAPSLAPLPGLTARREIDSAFMAGLQDRSVSEIETRFASGHRAYVAWWHGQPAAWGWVATRTATIGELGSTFTLLRGERYLWNFVTRPAHRGLGIYPRLLDVIVGEEAAEADRFWIAYAPENHASGAGIRKAGFLTVAELSFDAEGQPAVQGLVPGGGAEAARVFGLPAVEESLSPCWNCIRQGKPASAACRAGRCCCDYQRKEIACAA